MDAGEAPSRRRPGGDAGSRPGRLSPSPKEPTRRADLARGGREAPLHRRGRACWLPARCQLRAGSWLTGAPGRAKEGSARRPWGPGGTEATGGRHLRSCWRGWGGGGRQSRAAYHCRNSGRPPQVQPYYGEALKQGCGGSSPVSRLRGLHRPAWCPGLRGPGTGPHGAPREESPSESCAGRAHRYMCVCVRARVYGCCHGRSKAHAPRSSRASSCSLELP